MLELILIIAAVICLALATAGINGGRRVHLGWLGVALFVTAVYLIPRLT
jgi:hypothetical protein